jgi:predicted RNA binding protein YcfA (HicA-like mRNA interferase family)
LKYRDLLKTIEREGWRFKNQEGSHRQYVHPTKPGKVTLSGHPSDEVPPRILRYILRQAGIDEKP